MKRIAENVAVATICYVLSGLQKIRIVDYDSYYACTYNKNGTVIYDGTVADSLGYKYSKYFDSKCYGIDLDGDTIVFRVFTKFEEYK